jgi:hypothetical protein
MSESADVGRCHHRLMGTAPTMVVGSLRGVLRVPAARAVILLSSVVLALALGDIAAYHWVGHFQPVVRSDGEGYYIYLPAWFVDHDPTLVHTVARHFGATDYSFAGLVRNAHGYTDKYGIGVAVLEAPFFLAAQLLVSLVAETAGGYSRVDQITVLVAAGFYGVLGLAALRAFLRRRFSEPVVLTTLVALLLGTDLYHYLTMDGMFSHAFSFGAVSVMLLTLQRWEERPASFRRALFVGITAGLIVLIRPTNAVLLAVIPLYGIRDLGSLRQRVAALTERWRQVLVVVAAAGLTFAPQFLQWHAETGQWIVYPYPGETFSWLHPHLLQTLFSFDPHGLLPWSPVAALGIVGLARLRRSIPEMYAATAVSLLLGWYVISAWNNWWFGGGFGDRAFVDLFPLFALPLASLFASVRRPALRSVTAAIAVMAVAITTLQMIHYWQDRIPIQGATPADYVRVLFDR